MGVGEGGDGGGGFVAFVNNTERLKPVGVVVCKGLCVGMSECDRRERAGDIPPERMGVPMLCKKHLKGV